MQTCETIAVTAGSAFEARLLELRRRVAQSAQALSEQGIRPTVTRIRAALGGGSPNDLTPALKAWRESSAASFEVLARKTSTRLPVQIADLCVELWQRASTHAAVEIKAGSKARQAIAQDTEAAALRAQVRELRVQLQSELVSYGELRGQSARHEAAARDALKRLEESEARERRYLRDLGEARGRIVELDAAAAQQQERLAATAVARRKLTPTTPPLKARLAARTKHRGKQVPQKRRSDVNARAPSRRATTKRRKARRNGARK